jgi:hypothetical protein
MGSNASAWSGCGQPRAGPAATVVGFDTGIYRIILTDGAYQHIPVTSPINKPAASYGIMNCKNQKADTASGREYDPKRLNARARIRRQPTRGLNSVSGAE